MNNKKEYSLEKMILINCDYFEKIANLLEYTKKLKEHYKMIDPKFNELKEIENIIKGG